MSVTYNRHAVKVKDDLGVYHDIGAIGGGGGESPSPSSATPVMDGVGSAGSATTYSRGDHVHPTDTSRQASITANGILKGDGAGGVSAATAGTDYALPSAIPSASSDTPIVDGTATPGSSSAYSRGDHVHPTDTSRQASITANGILKGDGAGGVTAATAGTDYALPSAIPNASSSNPAMDGVGSAGSATTYSRGDHIHPSDSSKQDKITANGILKGDGAGGITAATSGTDYAIPSAIPNASSATPVMDGVGSAGSATTYSRGDHVHPSDTSRQPKITANGILKGDGDGGVTAATAGTDYAIPSAIPSASSDTPIVDGTASAGSATTYSRGDHVHPTDTSRAAAADLGAANGIATLNANARLSPLQAVANYATVTANTTLDASYVGTHIFVSAVLARTITIPADNTNTMFPIGTQIIIWQTNFGAVTITGASGVYFDLPDGTTVAAGSVTISTQNNNIAFLKRDATHWLVSGAVS